jgi:hypothetical protein
MAMTTTVQDDYDPLYPDSRDNDWPYNTDDKYSLFYYYPQKVSNEKDIEDEDTNQEEDTIRSNTESVFNLKEYGSKPVQADQNLNIPPNLIRNPPIHPPSLPDTLAPTSLLERILLLVSCIVVLLLILLLIILSRNTHTSSAFTLLDNSDGVSSYHSVSPPDVTPHISSPGVSGVYLPPSHFLSLTPSPANKEEKTLKSSKPISSPPSLPAPPLRLVAPGEGVTIIPPAVLRSLRNINPLTDFQNQRTQ